MRRSLSHSRTSSRPTTSPAIWRRRSTWASSRDPVVFFKLQIVMVRRDPLRAEARAWHGLRRFRLRRFENVNIDGLLVAASENLKRFLAATDWGRRHAPCGSPVVLPRKQWRLVAALLISSRPDQRQSARLDPRFLAEASVAKVLFQHADALSATIHPGVTAFAFRIVAERVSRTVPTKPIGLRWSAVLASPHGGYRSLPTVRLDAEKPHSHPVPPKAGRRSAR